MVSYHSDPQVRTMKNRIAVYDRYEYMAEVLERNLELLPDLPQAHHDLLADIKKFLDAERPFRERYAEAMHQKLFGSDDPK